MAAQHIIIVGCGRLGGSLANQLSKSGNDVVVIDRKEAAFDKLGADFTGFKLIGDAVEVRILRLAQVERTDVLFATTTSDNTNLMIAQVAKVVFKVQKVVARVFDPAREALYRDFGVTTISPTKLSAAAFLNTFTE
jgi:trk system potassium uptake protein